ncbi:hypothetical protein BD769DRAFT_1395456 [Suillus cothurnatus]|nr:hypothetical protein BD769DRAFT_1395456 [Suillus cothurnatus]
MSGGKFGLSGTLISFPLARVFKAIACLESSQTDLSDIGLYYFAIGATLKQIFDSDNNPFSSEESGQIRAIFNSRFREALSEGPTDAPISALYLHPRYVNSKLFQKNLNPLALTFVLPAHGGTHKGKGKAKAEEIEGNDDVDNEWPEVWE